jgi:hypothetical protein
MVGLLGGRAAWRWFPSLLVVLLVLGHLCDLETLANLPDHHADTAAGHAGELVSTCDPAPATSSPTSARVWTALDVSGSLPRVAAGSARVSRHSESSARLVDRPPLFLLHASFLI